jgi:hypothetical protein
MRLFISSTDYANFSHPRELQDWKPALIQNRNCFIVNIYPGLIGQEFGYGDTDINEVCLVGRFDDSIGELSSFPIHVHVFILRARGDNYDSFENLINIAWACVYDSLEDARMHKV